MKFCRPEFDSYCSRVSDLLWESDIPGHSITHTELRAAYSEGISPEDCARNFGAYIEGDCDRRSHSQTECEAFYLRSQ